MGLDCIPAFLRDHYEIVEWNHATAILKEDFPGEWSEIKSVLTNFRLLKSQILAEGGSKSLIAKALDQGLYDFGWKERHFDTRIVVDENERRAPTHSIDCYKNKIGLEIEWNNKDPFFDRDLNNFRLLFELRTISVGVIVTRCSELQNIFKALGKGKSYGNSTTHMGKLLPKVQGGGSGGCPLLVFGIKPELYIEDC